MGDQVLAVKDGSLLFDDVYFFGHANATEAIPASVGGCWWHAKCEAARIAGSGTPSEFVEMGNLWKFWRCRPTMLDMTRKAETNAL